MNSNMGYSSSFTIYNLNSYSTCEPIFLWNTSAICLFTETPISNNYLTKYPPRSRRFCHPMIGADNYVDQDFILCSSFILCSLWSVIDIETKGNIERQPPPFIRTRLGSFSLYPTSPPLFCERNACYVNDYSVHMRYGTVNIVATTIEAQKV